VQYIAPSFPNHPQNKRETQNKKQNRKDIEDHSRPRCNVFEPFVSFDQSYHLAPLYSVKGVHNVAPIEHGKQTFHRSLRVPAVFPQDAPGVLNSANDGILVGLFMTVRQLHEIRIQDGGRIFVPVWRCGFMSRRLTRQSRVLSYSHVGLIKPAWPHLIIDRALVRRALRD
jgi:hypothetical protein